MESVTPKNVELADEEETKSYRIRSAMVLFALEEALGAFVVQSAPDPEFLPEGIKKEIEGRSTCCLPLPVGNIVQESYLKEVIDLARNVAKNRSECDLFGDLCSVIEAYKINDIRNAVCHPNRHFPEYFWYKVAALACDPCIEKLRFKKVTDAFRCAVAGRISRPPDEWFQQFAWCVPNNLPQNFDHQITGLIGRKNERKELQKRLANMRNSLIAVVGPGGTGKTALCLDLLREVVLDTTTLEWTDEIVYVTAKTEMLTVDGIEPIDDPLSSLDSVQEAIADALIDDDAMVPASMAKIEHVKRELADRRLLLCVDNLETVLRDHPQDFENFVQSLPRDWRVLVTSRVSVNGANVLSLGQMQHGIAMVLGRNYMSVRTAEKISEENLSKLVNVCNGNPLAIRLTIDSFAAGTELAKALEQTKDRIIDFSYTSLVEHLSDNATLVLECLFGSNLPLARGEIGHLLELGPDDVAEVMNSLLRTSLITRKDVDSGEKYALSSSVKDLLIRSPRNQDVREHVYEKLKKQQRLLTELNQQNIDCLDEIFVAPEEPPYVKELAAEMRQSLRGKCSHFEKINQLTRIRQAIEREKIPALFRLQAILLEKLSDRYGAIESLNSALHGNDDDYASRLKMAEILRDVQQLEEAVDLTRPLVENGFLQDETVSQRNRERLLRAHWVSSLWARNYNEVIEATEPWVDMGILRPGYTALRIAALSRYVDESDLSAEEITSKIHDIFYCASEGFRLDGYLFETVREAFRACKRCLKILRYGSLSEESVLETSNFLADNLVSMCAANETYSLQDDFPMQLISAFSSAGNLKNNPLRSPRWKEIFLQGEPEESRVLSEYGYEESRITHLRLDRGYFFARALDHSNDFYIHVSSTELSNEKLSSLRVGQLIQVLPSTDEQQPGQARAAQHAMIAEG